MTTPDKLTPLTDPDAVEFRDVETEGDVTQDPAWRALVGLDEGNEADGG